MQLKCEYASLVLLATSKRRDTHVLVVTFGLLVDAEGKVMPAEQTWSWIAERMGKQTLDRGLKKSRGTFAVQGQAYALTDAQRAGMAVRVSLGKLEKTLHVFPPRQWNKGLLGWMPVTSGQIDCLPLTLENAYGGAQWADNPVGKGYCADTDTAGGTALAQLEVANLSVCDPKDRPAIASFMPLPPQSAARSAFMGTLDEDWTAYRAPFLPIDTDARWFDEVAQDQCNTEFWRGDEAWSVTGMHPAQAQVSGRLPGLRPRLFVERTDKRLAITEAPMDLDTVWLFPEAQSVLLLYRAEVSVLDIDAQDIATLAMALERVADAELDKQTWIDQLWPRPPVEPVEIPPTEPPVFDSGPMIASVQAAADAIHAELSVAHEQSLQIAQDMATGMDMPFNRADHPPLVKLNFAAFMGEPQAPAKPFDPEALRAEIETELAQAKADSMRHARSAITRLSLDVEETLALANQPVPEVDLMGVLARLDLPQAQQADMVEKVAAGLSRSQAMEASIDQQLAVVEKALAADRIKFGPAPTPAAYCNLTRESLQALHLAGKSLQNLSLNGLDLSGLDLGQADLKRTLFENCQLKGACLANTDLSQSQFIGCDLTAARLDKACLQETLFQRVLCQGASFKGANLLAIRASQSDFSTADFTEANLQQAQLNECSLDKAQLSNANLSQLHLNKCDLSGALFTDGNLHKAKLYDCTLDATDMRRANLSKADFAKVVGRDLDLRECNLQNLRLAAHCVLPGVRLDDADLTAASFQDVDLNHASLRGARLNDALLTGCDLSDSDGVGLIAQGIYLSGCDLSRADWSGANLLNGRLRKVCLEQTNLSGSNLHGLASDAVHGSGVRLEQALMTRCRLKESLTHA